MKYGIIGVGAIGGYYGSKLAYSGQEVHFLSHSDYQYVKEHGMQVDSCDGSFHLDHVNVYQHAEDMPKCDVVIVGLKTTNNHLLSSFLPPLLHEHTVVVLIQNGIGVEADVQKMFPDVQLVAGLAFICSAKTEPGRVNPNAMAASISATIPVATRPLLPGFSAISRLQESPAPPSPTRRPVGKKRCGTCHSTV